MTLLDQYGNPLSYVDALVEADGRVRAAGPGRGLASRGPRNPVSGRRTLSDRRQYNEYLPAASLAREDIDYLYRWSWVAGRMVDMPIDDMFIMGRRRLGATKEQLDAINKAERELGLYKKLARALKLGRLYGGGMLLVITGDDDLTTELDPELVGDNSIVDFIPVDRHQVRITDIQRNIFQKGYGQPTAYEIFFRRTQERWPIHASRTIKFSGREALSADGWQDEPDSAWGKPLFERVMDEVMNDDEAMSVLIQLLGEASMPYVKTSAFEDALTTGVDPESALGERATAMTRQKSVWKMWFMGPDDEIGRLDIRLAGWGDLVMSFMARLAAAAGIPATRFLGRSPSGMNATGVSDSVNYSETVLAMQKDYLEDPLLLLDLLIARHAGINEPLGYHWLPLTDTTETDQADIARQNMETLTGYEAVGLLTPNQVLERAARDPLIGPVPPLPDGDTARDPLQMRVAAQTAALSPQANPRNDPNGNQPNNPR